MSSTRISATDTAGRPSVVDLAREAVDRGLIVIYGLMGDGLTEGRLGFHVEVATSNECGGRMVRYARDVNPQVWKSDYAAIASSKNQISFRESRPSVDVPLEERQEGDTQYWGSDLRLPVGVAISGLQPWLDELGAGVISSIFYGLLKHYKYIERGFEPNRSKPDFLTDEYLAELRAAEGAISTSN